MSRAARRPPIGSRWIWEPDRPDARTNIVVTDVRWNGAEWFVQTGNEHWNDLARFWEACTPDLETERTT